MTCSFLLNCVPSHSFGYECTKRENLHILDTNTVVFSAGNLVQILDLKTMEQTYIGGTNDGGIGAIAVSVHSDIVENLCSLTLRVTKISFHSTRSWTTFLCRYSTRKGSL